MDTKLKHKILDEAANAMQDVMTANVNAIPLITPIVPELGMTLMATDIIYEGLYNEDLNPKVIVAGLVKLIQLTNPEYTSTKLSILKSLIHHLEAYNEQRQDR